MRTPKPILLVAILAFLGSPSWAEGAPLSSARDESPEFKEAVHALKVDQKDKAYRLFTERWTKAPSFDVAVLLGQTELLMGKYRDAAEHFTLALRDFPPTEAPRKKEQIRGALDQAKAKVGTLKVTIDKADAEVAIDGKAVGKTPFDVDLYVEPGTHTITATHPTGSVDRIIDVSAGDQRAINLKIRTTADSTAPKLPYGSTELDDPGATRDQRAAEGRTSQRHGGQDDRFDCRRRGDGCRGGDGDVFRIEV
ncbi:MAG: PEGA domain-containing protein [Polyangiaceae bacterium]